MSVAGQRSRAEPSDEILIGAVAQGSDGALRSLYHRYERPLYAFIVRNGVAHDAEDLCQETWLRVVRAAARFDRERRFSTWLFQIALNLCRDWHRRNPRGRADVVLERAEPPSEDAPEMDRSRSATTEARIDAGRLLGSLPEAQRDVLLLRYYHGFSEDETAEILGCPRGTVKSRLHHAVLRLTELASSSKEDRS